MGETLGEGGVGGRPVKAVISISPVLGRPVDAGDAAERIAGVDAVEQNHGIDIARGDACHPAPERRIG